jgi:hypothetical protein
MMINFLKLTSRFCGDAAQMILTTMSSFQDMEYEESNFLYNCMCGICAKNAMLALCM